ncbi:MAG: FadR/GntR family transcriptional regulator [Nocardioidaceae bacterium]
MSAVLLRPVRGAHTFEATVEQLATTIQLGVFAVGDRLPPERELAAAMRVSRATLREAIAALRQAGLVSTRSGRGGGNVICSSRSSGSAGPDDVRTGGLTRRTQARARVEADVARYRDTLVVCRVVEPGAAAVAAGRDLTAEQRSWLRGTLDEVSSAGDPLQYRQADSRLHLALAALSGSRQLLDLVTTARRDLLDLLDAIPVLHVNIAHSNDQHTRIVEAVLDGDGEQARGVMERHCDASAALLRGLLGLQESPPTRNGT